MKIIGWNCNGAFRKKSEKVLSLNPDILIISECENIERLKIGKLIPEPNDVKWFGEKLAGIFQLKTSVVGGDNGEVKEPWVLHRVLRVPGRTGI